MKMAAAYFGGVAFNAWIGVIFPVAPQGQLFLAVTYAAIAMGFIIGASAR